MTDSNSLPSGVADAIAAGKLLAGVQTIPQLNLNGTAPFLVLPSGHAVHDLEKLGANPAQRRGIVALHDVDSFCHYVKLFASPTVQVFAKAVLTGTNIQAVPATFVAVLDYHEAGAHGMANWGVHRAVYECKASPEWETWTGCDRKPMSQKVFAQFIEDNLPDMVSPDGASMLEISRKLEAKTNADFKSSQRLDNGDIEFAYTTETTTKVAGGTMEIPAEFQIGVPVFVGGAPFKVTARLRYRLEAGNLTLWYELVRTHKIIEATVDDIVKIIKDVTDLDVLMGNSPEKVSR